MRECHVFLLSPRQPPRTNCHDSRLQPHNDSVIITTIYKNSAFPGSRTLCRLNEVVGASPRNLLIVQCSCARNSRAAANTPEIRPLVITDIYAADHFPEWKLTSQWEYPCYLNEDHHLRRILSSWQPLNIEEFTLRFQFFLFHPL